MNIKSILRSLLFLLILMPLVGCLEPGDSTQNGKFIDDVVIGLRFSTGTQSGVTDKDGTFQYFEGETVQFFIGDILIGETLGKAVVTPLDLVSGAMDETNAQVINLIRFLQTLDEDQNPSNGIVISSLTKDAALGKTVDFEQSEADFEASTEVQAVISDLTSVLGEVRSLVATRDAQAHLRTSIFGLLKGRYEGVFSGDDRGSWQLTINDQGNIEGVSVSDDFGSNVISGSVGINGVASIAGTAGDATFSGFFSFGGSVSGVWENVAEGDMGTFSGERDDSDPCEAVFCVIDVQNASFERSDDVLFFTDVGNFNTSVQEWEISGPVGTIRPSTPGNRIQIDMFSVDVPEGQNTIFANGNASASQVLDTLLTNKTRYKLELEVGKGFFLNLPDAYSAELRAGGMILATGTTVPGNGQFEAISFEYVSQAGDPFGEPLEIHLLTTHSSTDDDTVQLHWDNIRLSYKTIS